jgi:membrane dipeptidase
LRNRIRPALLIGLVGLLAPPALAQPTSSSPPTLTHDQALARANALLARAPVIDGHNDLAISLRMELGPNALSSDYGLQERAKGQTDLPRLRAGHVGGQLWSVFIPGDTKDGFAKTQLEQIALMRRVIAAHPEQLTLALSANELEAAMRAGKLGGLLAMEGGYGLEGSLGALRAYYDLGVRSMGLVHDAPLDWADSQALPAAHGGLTELGEQVVREMNRLGMLVDLSHSSDETALDAMRVSRAPVIFSHQAARALCDIPRNAPDEVLRALRANGGIVMITFVGGFVSQEVSDVVRPAMKAYRERVAVAQTPAEREALRNEIFGALKLPEVTVARVADHVEHARDIAGVDHVGIGGDFDGAFGFPQGLSDVSMYPNLFAELALRGWSDAELAKLASGNFLRVMREVEAASGDARASGARSEAKSSEPSGVEQGLGAGSAQPPRVLPPLGAPAKSGPPTPGRDRSR